MILKYICNAIDYNRAVSLVSSLEEDTFNGVSRRFNVAIRSEISKVQRLGSNFAAEYPRRFAGVFAEVKMTALYTLVKALWETGIIDQSAVA